MTITNGYARARRLLAVAALLAVALQLATPAARAEKVWNYWIPISGTTVNPCNFDTVTFTGTAHVVLAWTVDQAGNGHGTFHVEMPNGLGIGTTGDRYTLNEVINNGGSERGELERLILSTHFQFIGQGAAPNFLVNAQFHATLTSEGYVKVNVLTLDETCIG
jgi:hypothetical protein